MPNAKQRRTLRRAIDRCVSVLTGLADGPTRLARRFRLSRSFWRLVERREQGGMWGDRDDCYECGAYIGAAGYCRVCSGDDDDWQDDDWDDEDRDEDDDILGCWESGTLRRGLCPDDLCHGANRCMAKARPWEGGDESSEEVPDAE